MDARERVVVRELDRHFPRSLRSSQVLLKLTECGRDAETEACEHFLVVVHAQDLTHGGVAVQIAGAELLAVRGPGAHCEYILWDRLIPAVCLREVIERQQEPGLHKLA